MENLTAIEIARRFADTGEKVDACRAYAIVANDAGAAPEERMEAAIYILQAEDNYRVSYLCFLDLFVHGQFREDILGILTEAFYAPNEKELKNRYHANCRALKKYPYLFRKEFPEFESLPIRFFPYDDGKYFPYDRAQGRFGDLNEPGAPVIRHYFFRDLEKPILAEDIFSQYELEYLNDNVRPSEWVGRENHIYLHYSDWQTFCSWLQVLDFRPLLKGKKLVFLIGEEISRYPIDFDARFGIDYRRYPVKPVGIREINRLIWHTQFSTHNGGDFFNEVFDAHPNLIAKTSVMLSDVNQYVNVVRDALSACEDVDMALQAFASWDNSALVRELYGLKNRTDKDIFVAMYLGDRIGKKGWREFAAPNSRIVPAIFFQPHFPTIKSSLQVAEGGYVLPTSGALEAIRSSPVFQNFKYIKTFTPVRRFTTSYGASVRFMYDYVYWKETWDALKSLRPEDKRMGDVATDRILNRSFMIDPEDRLYRDSVIVRFEDGKLNPKATFTALAEFLDLPYTESMTYCSEDGTRDPRHGGNAVGFDTKSVYRKYEDYTGNSDRYYIEFFLRDAYTYFGYDFHYYDGKPVDEARLDALISDFETLDDWLRKTQRLLWERMLLKGTDRELTEEEAQELDYRVDARMELIRAERKNIAHTLLNRMRFVNRNGQPLRMAPKLRLDPALLENELYH